MTGRGLWLTLGGLLALTTALLLFRPTRSRRAVEEIDTTE